MDGLRIKDGRLINDRPPSESGIAKLCRLKNDIRRSQKVSIIADGVDLADQRKKFFEGKR